MATGAQWSRLKKFKEFLKKCSYFWLISATENQHYNWQCLKKVCPFSSASEVCYRSKCGNIYESNLPIIKFCINM